MNEYAKIKKKNLWLEKFMAGNPLVVQWLGFHTSTAGGSGSIPGWELRSCMPQGVAKKNKKVYGSSFKS